VADAQRESRRLQAPARDVVVPAGNAVANVPAGASVVVVPVLTGSGASNAGVAGGAAVRPGAGSPVGAAGGNATGAAAAGNPAGLANPAASASAPKPMNLNLPYLRGPYAQQPRRSLAEMANEQLRQGREPRDAFADDMARGSKVDCTRPGGTGTVGGLLAAPLLAARALAGDCPK